MAMEHPNTWITSFKSYYIFFTRSYDMVSFMTGDPVSRQDEKGVEKIQFCVENWVKYVEKIHFYVENWLERVE